MFNSKEKQLVKACQKGDRATAEKLLNEGANINAVANDNTPFTAAVFNGHFELAEFLLGKGADIEKTWFSGTPLLSSSDYDMPAFEFLIAHGADTQAIDGSGWNILHYAAYRGKNLMVEKVVALGIDPAARTNSGDTAANLAHRNDHEGIAEFLKELTKPKLTHPHPTGWHVTGDQEVSHVEEKPVIGFTVTDIFNFAAGSYTHVITAANSQSQTMRYFSEMPDQAQVEAARRQLTVLNANGTALAPDQTPSSIKPKSPPTI